MSSASLLILSGSDHLRFPTQINHRAYADRHGLRYRFDMTPRQDVRIPFFHKLQIIADALQDCEWLFWLDDDAAFMQLEMPLQTLVPELSDPSLLAVFCRSPVNLQGGWTHLSSGNFFLRNDPRSFALLDRACKANLNAVRDWWGEEKYGIFTWGDQDALVYVIENDAELKTRCAILEFDRFNARPYHFKRRDQYFLVHFTHSADFSKREQMRQFASKFGLTPFLLEESLVLPYANYGAHQLAMLGERGGEDYAYAERLVARQTTT